MTVTIKLLAHASFQIKSDNEVIYIDPSSKGTGLSDKGLEPADLILITHAHDDHCDPNLIKKIRKFGHPIIAPENCKKKIGKAGLVWDIAAGQFMQMADSNQTKIRAVEAYNVKRFRKPGEPFHPKGFGVGYIITVEGKRIYYAGDTDLIPEMENVEMIDVALLPSGDMYTMDMAEAAEAAVLINPDVAIPMHLRGADPAPFKSAVEGKSSTKVVILGEGDTYTLE